MPTHSLLYIQTHAKIWADEPQRNVRTIFFLFSFASFAAHKQTGILSCTGKALSVPHEGRREVEFPLPFGQHRDPTDHVIYSQTHTASHTESMLLTQPRLVFSN